MAGRARTAPLLCIYPPSDDGTTKGNWHAVRERALFRLLSDAIGPSDLVVNRSFTSRLDGATTPHHQPGVDPGDWRTPPHLCIRPRVGLVWRLLYG